MATQAQITANRRNARRSTGPRTDAGKARVSRNAVKHGLRSKDPVVPDPSDTEFRELLANWESALEPATDLERDAARRCQKRAIAQTNPIPASVSPVSSVSNPHPPNHRDSYTMNTDMTHPTRRELAATAAFTLVPRHVLGGPGYQAPSDTLNLAGIGVGGMGKNYLKGVNSQNIVALCDVDDKKAAPVYATYPAARTYRDFRMLLEKEKGVDGVVIGTPDHTHAVIMMAALKLGKHVYCAKPLTRTIAESRAIRNAAREAKVATQMSVQSCASDASLTTAEWVRSGAIGKVHEVHVWSDRPVWPQGMFRPKTGQPVPSTLDWDLWLGPAQQRPYSDVYHPFKFRGWYDFGTGALGDMGCHTFHVIVRSLELGDPITVSATHADVIRPLRSDEETHWSGNKRVQFPETYPHASIVTWQFPQRGKLPPVTLTWYDGGLKPPCPPDWTPGEPLPADGILFKGSKGVLFSKFTGTPSLLPAARNAGFKPPKPKLQRTIGHYEEWIEACKGGRPANCEFDFATYLTELTLLGNLAVRTGERLTWDPTEARTNSSAANQFLDDPYRAGWSL